MWSDSRYLKLYSNLCYSNQSLQYHQRYSTPHSCKCKSAPTNRSSPTNRCFGSSCREIACKTVINQPSPILCTVLTAVCFRVSMTVRCWHGDTWCWWRSSPGGTRTTRSNTVQALMNAARLRQRPQQGARSGALSLDTVRRGSGSGQ